MIDLQLKQGSNTRSMTMNEETRTQKIALIVSNTAPYGRQDVLWHGERVPMDVYDVPLEYLIYNKYNGRILSRTKTLESQGKILNPENEEDKEKIEYLLWESKESRNENTLKDISDKGQLKVGIITRDGVVIDGNRRVMLLNKLNKSHFRAIILPVKSTDDPIEIEKLETIYQMGEDEKLGYNPIEKYLKAKTLFKKLTPGQSEEEAVKRIAEWMGESVPQIEEWLEVVGVIDAYLEYQNYPGIYAMADTPGDGKEDLFLFLRKWLNTFRDKESDKGFDNYTSLDVDDLQTVCFDYIRAKVGGDSYDGKLFRRIADGARESHFFGNKKIWSDFQQKHEIAATPAIEQIDADHPIDYGSDHLEQTLSARDIAYRDLVLDSLTENIEEHVTLVRFHKEANKPGLLVGDAIKAISAINPHHENFSSPEVLEQMETLINKSLQMVKRKSPESTLSIILDLLNGIEIDTEEPNKDKLRDQLKEIGRIVYQMRKQL